MQSDIEGRITAALLERYRPTSILLHGSRAIGKERPHSDWDIVMLFYGSPVEKSNREMVLGECIEWKAYNADDTADVLSVFGLHLQHARVLFDSDAEGANLIKRARRSYIRGPNLSVRQIAREKLYFEQKILGLEDDVGRDALFFRHLHAVFILSTKLWFELVENRFNQPIYLALPYIQEADPAYHSALTGLLCSTDRLSQIASAKKMLSHLFVENEFRYHE